MAIAAIESYVIDTQGPATERAAWTLIEAGARKGLFDQLRQGLVSSVDLKLARQFLESRGAMMQIPPDHRAMYLKLIGESERFLRAHSKLERPATLSGGDNLGGIFDAIWSGIKAVGGVVGKGAKAVVKGAGAVFQAGQQTQANAAAIQVKAEEIAANVSATVKTARSVTDAVSTELTAGKIDSVAGGFFKSDTMKWVLIGGAALVLVMVAKGGRQTATGGRR